MTTRCWSAIAVALAMATVLGCGDDGETSGADAASGSSGSTGGASSADTGAGPVTGTTTTSTSTGGDGDGGDATGGGAAGGDGAGGGAGGAGGAGGGSIDVVDGAASLAVGGGWACAIKTEGTLWCWGNNVSFSLGQTDASIFSSDVPLQVGTDTDWVSVSRGATCAIKSDGRMFCWSTNFYGQVGNGNEGGDQVGPDPWDAEGPWVVADQGPDFQTARAADGTIWGSGNAKGQLGPDGPETTNVPLQMGADDDWAQHAAGAYFTCGIKENGSAWCLGRAEVLGGAETPDTCTFPVGACSKSFVSMGAAADWHHLSAGSSTAYVLATKDDGTLWCWGSNDGGCGTGKLGGTQVPTQVGSDTWETAISGEGQSCGIRSDGSLWCWGYNDSGQVGNGTFGATELSPVQVGEDSDWAEAAPGYLTTCARKTDGSIWCWGRGSEGQLGNDATEHSTTPVQVVGF